MANLIIDNVEVKAKEGDNLLWTALENGFYIPNLCSIKEAKYQQSSCRLCFVEIKGNNSPVTACTQKIVDGMQVYLNSARVHRKEKGLPLSNLTELLAIATDEKLDSDVPQISLNDYKGIADIIENKVIQKRTNH
jgi:predicted molibdopterin-dependent oxidoreductase YjgC